MSRTRALTLIELLAVIVLLSLVTSTLTGSLRPVSPSAASLRAWWSAIDSTARSHALAGTCVMLQNGARSTLCVRPDSSPVSHHRWPPGVDWIDLDAPTSFDRSGRTDDYEVHIRTDSGARITVAVHGLTGRVTELE